MSTNKKERLEFARITSAYGKDFEIEDMLLGDRTIEDAMAKLGIKVGP